MTDVGRFLRKLDVPVFLESLVLGLSISLFTPLSCHSAFSSSAKDGSFAHWEHLPLPPWKPGSVSARLMCGPSPSLAGVWGWWRTNFANTPGEGCAKAALRGV